MANTKTSALTTLNAVPADDDFHLIVDKSDTSMAVTGTNKQIQEKFYLHTNGTANTLAANLAGNGKNITGVATISANIGDFGTVELGTATNFKSYNDTAVSVIEFDSGDTIRYNRSQNQYEVFIGSNTVAWLGGDLGVMSAVPLTETVVGVPRVSIGVAAGWSEILFEQSGQIRNIGLNSGVLYFYKPGTALMTLDGSGNLDLALGGLTFSGGGKIGNAWTGLSYGSGWTDYGSGFQTGQYKKIGDLVLLRGLIKRTSGTANLMFTLPAGNRPSTLVLNPVITFSGMGRLDLDSSGATYLQSGGAEWVSLEGILFSVL